MPLQSVKIDSLFETNCQYRFWKPEKSVCCEKILIHRLIDWLIDYTCSTNVQIVSCYCKMQKLEEIWVMCRIVFCRGLEYLSGGWVAKMVTQWTDLTKFFFLNLRGTSAPKAPLGHVIGVFVLFKCLLLGYHLKHTDIHLFFYSDDIMH